jgi:hypothetical protein
MVDEVHANLFKKSIKVTHLLSVCFTFASFFSLDLFSLRCGWNA